MSRRPVGKVPFGWLAGPGGRSGIKWVMEGKIKEDCKEERKQRENTGKEIWRRNKSARKNHCQVFELSERQRLRVGA